MDLQHALLLLGVIVLVLAVAFWDRLFVKFTQYVLLPIRSRHDTVVMRRQRTPIDLTQLPAEIAPVFHGLSRDLAAAGFRAVGHFFTKAGTSRLNSRAWESVWAAPDQTTTVQVMGVQVQVQRPGMPVRTRTAFVFRSAFRDGSELATSSSQSAGVCRRDPRIDGVVWPGMQDLNVLWRLHQGRLARHGPEKEAVPPPGSAEQAQEYLEQIEARGMRVQVDGGYFTADESAGVYRRTLKGSFLMTWHLLWPWKGINRRAQARKLARVLAEVGMGRPEDYPLLPRPDPHAAQQTEAV